MRASTTSAGGVTWQEALPQPPGCAALAGRVGGRAHLFDTSVSTRYLVCIFPVADYITACVDKHLELEQSSN